MDNLSEVAHPFSPNNSTASGSPCSTNQITVSIIMLNKLLIISKKAEKNSKQLVIIKPQNNDSPSFSLQLSVLATLSAAPILYRLCVPVVAPAQKDIFVKLAGFSATNKPRGWGKHLRAILQALLEPGFREEKTSKQDSRDMKITTSPPPVPAGLFPRRKRISNNVLSPPQKPRPGGSLARQHLIMAS